MWTYSPDGNAQPRRKPGRFDSRKLLPELRMRYAGGKIKCLNNPVVKDTIGGKRQRKKSLSRWIDRLSLWKSRNAVLRFTVYGQTIATMIEHTRHTLTRLLARRGFVLTAPLKRVTLRILNSGETTNCIACHASCMVTYRVKYKGTASNDWVVHRSGRQVSRKGTKQAAVNYARANASKGDTLIVERRNGSKQKEVTISSSNEDRLDMNEGSFSIF